MLIACHRTFFPKVKSYLTLSTFTFFIYMIYRKNQIQTVINENGSLAKRKDIHMNWIKSYQRGKCIKDYFIDTCLRS